MSSSSSSLSLCVWEAVDFSDTLTLYFSYTFSRFSDHHVSAWCSPNLLRLKRTLRKSLVPSWRATRVIYTPGSYCSIHSASTWLVLLTPVWLEPLSLLLELERLDSLTDYWPAAAKPWVRWISIAVSFAGSRRLLWWLEIRPRCICKGKVKRCNWRYRWSHRFRPWRMETIFFREMETILV